MPSTEKLPSDEARLESDFQQLVERLRSPDGLNPQRAAPVFYFVYAPRLVLKIRQLLPVWVARLKNQYNLTVETISIAGILWELVDESGRWEDWLELEGEFDVEPMNEAIRDVLRQDNAFVQSVTERVASLAGSRRVVFIIDVELLHPFFRTRPIEHALHKLVQAPVVFFYPGRRSGQYGLRFLEFYPEDPGYRSTLIGGLQ